VSDSSHQTRYRFRLYVTGDAQNSSSAISNLALICHVHLAGRFETEIVDVFKEPRRALDDQVFMTPTLVTLAPRDVHRIVGNLSNHEPVLLALGLDVVAA
jgi:circadian clock protein KaiB